MAVEFQDSKATLSQTLHQVADSLTTETIQVRTLLEKAGEHGLLFFCMLLTVPFLIPVSIPGVSTIFGLVIILIGLGVMLNRVPWLPDFIMRREIKTADLVPALHRGANTFSRLDTLSKPRLSALTNGTVMNRLNGLALIFGAVLLLFPLGLVPLSNTLPALAILFLAVGSLQRDGILIVLGYLMLIATVVYFAALALAAIAAGQGIQSLLGS
ncbi:MAG: exopolysaccharide biosynthesis protein [Anaerolineae bacterium]|nr:exopolysaccharide biosynthesis protein [Anaerolineae bacterium]